MIDPNDLPEDIDEIPDPDDEDGPDFAGGEDTDPAPPPVRTDEANW